MPKLIVQIGPTTVVIRDDRAVMDKATLKAWKNAAKEIVVETFDLMTEEVPTDGE